MYTITVLNGFSTSSGRLWDFLHPENTATVNKASKNKNLKEKNSMDDKIKKEAAHNFESASLNHPIRYQHRMAVAVRLINKLN